MKDSLGNFYFNKQKVTLFEAPREQNASDILLSAQGRVTDALYLEGGAQYNASEGRTERYSFGLRYTPERAKSLSINYRGKAQVWRAKTYRIGLNIRNLFNDEELYGKLLNVEGQPIRIKG